MLTYIRLFALTLSILLFSIVYIKAQENNCETPSSPDIFRGQNMENLSRMDYHYDVRIFVHIINRTDGTGGVSSEDVLEEIAIMESDFEDHNISFSLLGIDFINNTFYTESDDNWKETRGELLIQENVHPGAVNIYIVPASAGHSGSAYAIPSNHFTMGAQRFGHRTMSHEMGHCLSLYHTHHTSFGDELVNGTNCRSAGDRICDTPADPKVSRAMNGCSYTGTFTDSNGDAYQPDPEIIMSYGGSCRNYFTPGQAKRMHTYLSMISCNEEFIHLNVAPTHNLTRSYLGYELINVSAVYTRGNFTMSADNMIVFLPGAEIKEAVDFRAYAANCIASQSETAFRVASSDNTSNHSSELLTTSGDVEEFKVFPNPFSTSATIEFTLPQTTETTLSIRNAIGQIVTKPVKNKLMPEGIHQIEFNGSHIPSGVHFCVLEVNGQQHMQKLLISR